MSRIGIFGGSFDPVHTGHIKLARFMTKELSLDKMIIIPTYVSPFKNGGSDAEDRYQMCCLAFTDEKFTVSRIETDRPERSYTVDTVKMLRQDYPEDELFLIVGSDQLKIFHKWYKFEEILSEVTLCAVSRDNGVNYEELQNIADENLRPFGKVIIKDFEPFEISSTEIRKKVSENENVDGYVSEEVGGYIKMRGLYRDI